MPPRGLWHTRMPHKGTSLKARDAIRHREAKAGVPHSHLHSHLTLFTLSTFDHSAAATPQPQARRGGDNARPTVAAATPSTGPVSKGTRNKNAHGSLGPPEKFLRVSCRRKNMSHTCSKMKSETEEKKSGRSDPRGRPVGRVLVKIKENPWFSMYFHRTCLLCLMT